MKEEHGNTVFGTQKYVHIILSRNHGSTVKLDGKQSRSVDTASGKKSIAELWAVQSFSNDQYFYRVC